MRKLPQLQDVTSDLQIKNPQISVDIDRDKASALGVTASQIEDALYSAYGQRQVATIYSPNNEYKVVMELKPEFQLDPSALSLLYVRASNGNLVPLSTVAKIEHKTVARSLNRMQQLNAVAISGVPTRSLDAALRFLEDEAHQSGVDRA